MSPVRCLSLLILVVSLTLTGCLSLVIREDDGVGIIAGKVIGRTLIAVPTLGISEIKIAEAKKVEEARPYIITAGSHDSRLTSDPSKETLTVAVWSNHPLAEGYVTQWAQSIGDTVVERTRLRNLLNEHKIRLTYSLDDASDLLRVGRMAGADIIIFADVNNVPQTIRGIHNTPGAIFPMRRMYSETLYHLNVNVKSINVQDGRIRWNGTATFNEPITNPDAGIGHLTQAAILRALCPVEHDGQWKEYGPWRKYGCLKRE